MRAEKANYHEDGDDDRHDDGSHCCISVVQHQNTDNVELKYVSFVCIQMQNSLWGG